MQIPNLKNKKIIIIEGIAGYGKNTLQKQLEEKYGKEGFLSYSYSEEELLLSWKHFWIKEIEDYRLNYMNALLDYFVKLIKENPKTIIILNRFHLTYTLFPNFNKYKYDNLIKRLRELPVHIFIGKLSEKEIENRAIHIERDEIWRKHQQKRLEYSKYNSLKELYKKEQKKILTIAKKQKIPYTIFEL